MSSGALVALALAVFGWSVLSEWLAKHNVTGPLVLVAAGFVLGNSDWGIVTVDIESSTIHALAEVTLALLLFADASKVPVRNARADLSITGRLLGVGLPLTFLAGLGLAVLLYPSVPIAIAGLIAASLAPTDAALSAPVLADERLPVEVRRVLNVESGMNDGIATPVVTYCIGAAATLLHIAHAEHESGLSALGAIVIGVAVGTGLALGGGRLLVVAHRRGWVQHGARRIATLTLALAAFVIATELGGNPFVAAFIAGLFFGAADREETQESVELTELTGSTFSLALWFIFGAGFVLPALQDLDVRIVLYALASLTVVRMVPVAISLIGSGHDLTTKLFMGWFGPRGLASVVFGLFAFEELGATDPGVKLALHTITITILCSIVAHGITAGPLARRYARAQRSGDS
jgi:NhaP-type Na+/H+ or K+/H+ antiporter